MSNGQSGLFPILEERSLLDQLLSESKLYKRSKAYKELLDFTVRLRNFAPFNAMLLNVQKPGLSYAASARDWRAQFGRAPKEGARPLLILWPFGPVALVYDVNDTEGHPLPKEITTFQARGKMTEGTLESCRILLQKKRFEWNYIDHGDRSAGSIQRLRDPEADGEGPCYRININRNHDCTVRFSTLVHELGHLFLGHLGKNKKLNVPERCYPDYHQREIEAESVAYIVCRRNSVELNSHSYLSDFVNRDTTIDEVDIYSVMRAAGQVETILGLADHTLYNNSSTST